MSTLAGDFDLLKQAVRDAGALALSFYGSELVTETKADRSPVSAADLAVDTFLKTALAGPRPAYGWLSEESEDDPARLTRQRVWVVDPIDGTRAFLRHDPQWVVSAALVEDGRPVLAAVFNPVTAEFYAARKNIGATLNDRPIHVSDRAGPEGCTMLAQDHIFASKRWDAPWPEMEISFRNSIAYRLCLVAAGKADAAISISPKSDWDIAAGDLVVHEAGGRFTGATGKPVIYNGETTKHPAIAAAGPKLHEKLRHRLRGLKTKSGKNQ